MSTVPARAGAAAALATSTAVVPSAGYAVEYDVRLPHPLYPFGALYENLRAFKLAQQYRIIPELSQGRHTKTFSTGGTSHKSIGGGGGAPSASAPGFQGGGFGFKGGGAASFRSMGGGGGPKGGGDGGRPTDVRKQCDPFPKCARRPGAEDRAPRCIHQVHDG